MSGHGLQFARGAKATLFSLLPRLSIAVLVAASIVSTAFAQQFERAPNTKPGNILGAAANGSNYRVESPVYGDGLLYIYSVRTHHGTYTINGSAYMAARILELRALAKLNKVSQTKTFINAAVKSGLSPVEFAGKAITNPVGTVVNTVSGVGELFGRVASGITNPGARKDGLIADTAGVSSAKRAIAAKLNVDPYSDFEPLQKKLTQVARATALGGLGVRAGLSAIPGAAGLAVSGVNTAGNLGNLVRDKTPQQLRDLNRSRLKSMGVPARTIKRFLGNKWYTSSDQTVVVSALHQLTKVGNRAVFIARAAAADSRDIVHFHRARAQLLAGHHKRVGRLHDFVSVRGVPLNRTANGRVLALFPIDQFAWTRLAGGALIAITKELKSKGLMNGAELRITGRATQMARNKAQSNGWRIVEGVR